MTSIEADIRQKIAEDIEAVKDNCLTNNVDTQFIAGLKTAIDLVTGEIDVHPLLKNDENQPTLF